MKPIVIDMLGVLLKQKAAITMCISSHGSVYDAVITDVKPVMRLQKVQGGWTSSADGWQLAYVFGDGRLDQAGDMRFDPQQLDIMTLTKRSNNKWMLT